MSEPLTFDRFLSLPRLSALRLSPDGKRLVVAVSRVGPEGKEMKIALWQVDPAGRAKPRRITRSAAGESVASFMRDGSLLFTSTRPDPDVKADPDHKSTPCGCSRPKAARLDSCLRRTAVLTQWRSPATWT